MPRYVVALSELGQAQAAVAGGKAANLGELSRIAGVCVPLGYCVTTDGFQRFMGAEPKIELALDRLARLGPADQASVEARSEELRRCIEETPIPGDLALAISGAFAELGGEGTAWAVRSSATAEDSPTTSFAGQHDSYLNVVGLTAVLSQVRRCWASLFSARAVSYRLRNGLDHRRAQMAVVLQQLVFARVAGVLFTADPVRGSRSICVVEAGFGFGEALVGGLLSPDVYQVRAGEVVAKTIRTKALGISAAPGGGTQHTPIEPDRQRAQTLTDAEVLRLAALGRRIEAHFGRPQDIEWCLVDDTFHVVQSRPITTLFPIPEVNDGERHVYLSVGHQQMMTDAMKPLGLSLFRRTSRAPMREAGGRLFVDVTAALASPASRASLLAVVGRADPLTLDALETLLSRGELTPSLEGSAGGTSPGGAPAPIETDPAIVRRLIDQTQRSLDTLEQDLRGKTGSALLDFILEDVAELQRLLFDPLSHQVIMAGMEASWWLNDQLYAWLGERSAADVLARSVSGNVTSEMGLELLAVADVIRPHPEVVAFLEAVEGDDFLAALPAIVGGMESLAALQAYLDRYGMRGVGEIDVTRPRFRERPRTLLPLLLANIKRFAPGAAERHFQQGQAQATQRERELLERVAALPDGAQRAEETKRMIDRVRTFAGYREFPKYGMVCRYFQYKRALLEEAERLVREGVLSMPEDIYYLSLEELHDVVRTKRADERLIRQRQEAFRSYQALSPPRVLTSDGEVLSGTYRRDHLPPGALVGLGVSAGVVEGRARVISTMAEAALEPGDVLVTTYTDPSWTPLFVGLRGLVTEVGGLMTHGAVIAREYGVPAVVAVERATLLIRDGQRIRVNGTDGLVELLS